MLTLIGMSAGAAILFTFIAQYRAQKELEDRLDLMAQAMLDLARGNLRTVRDIEAFSKWVN